MGGAVGGMGNRGCRTSCLAFVVSINNASNTRNQYLCGPRYPEAHDIRIQPASAMYGGRCQGEMPHYFYEMELL